MLAGGQDFELDYRLLSAGRATRTLHMIARPDPGRPGCYRGTVQDVTGARISELALRERTEALAAVIDGAPIGMALSRPGPRGEWRFERVNAALCEMLGYSAPELLSKSLRDVTHPDDLAASIARHDALVAGRPVRTPAQKRYVHRDGRTIWVKVSFATVADERGAPLTVIAQIQDVTAERVAARATARLAAVVESSHEAMIAQTLDGLITDWNPAAERMYGYRAGEAVGEPVSMLLASEDERPELREILQSARSGRATEGFVTTRRRKDGQLVDVELSVSTIRDQHGRIVGLSTVARDISDANAWRRRYDRARSASSRRKTSPVWAAGNGT